MKPKKLLLSAALSAFVINSAGCGVLLYPERQGQEGGRIDPVVAILDGIGLLLFVVPGLVAFAVDFHQGTIYLPDGASAGVDATPNYRAVKVDGPMTEENIEAALKAELGQDVDITAADVQARLIENGLPGLNTALAQASQGRVLL